MRIPPINDDRTSSSASTIWKVWGKDLANCFDKRTSPWDGVRNYQARNLMKSMKVGEKAFLYHSNCKIPGIAGNLARNKLIAGIMEICKEAYPDCMYINGASHSRHR